MPFLWYPNFFLLVPLSVVPGYHQLFDNNQVQYELCQAWEALSSLPDLSLTLTLFEHIFLLPHTIQLDELPHQFQ